MRCYIEFDRKDGDEVTRFYCVVNAVSFKHSIEKLQKLHYSLYGYFGPKLIRISSNIEPQVGVDCSYKLVQNSTHLEQILRTS